MTVRVALVTGGAVRIGEAIARQLARDGWGVLIHARRSLEKAEAVATSLRAQGGIASVVAGDLADPAVAETLLPTGGHALGPVTLLVNNASEFLHDTVETMTADTWTKHLDVNLRAPVFLAQQFARQLPDGFTGNIVNIIDQRVWAPTPDFLSYGISKAGLLAATKMLAQALAPRIRVNAIGPGPVLASVHQTPGEFEQEERGTLLMKGARVEEIAAAVRFILDAPAMTGQMIALDGGQHLDWPTRPR